MKQIKEFLTNPALKNEHEQHNLTKSRLIEAINHRTSSESIAKEIKIGKITAPKLVIFCKNGAQASKLKQFLPHLIKTAQEIEPEIKTIEFKVDKP